MKSNKLLIIFTRNPELGKVKTRLAKSIGDEKALELYQLLLDKTKNVTSVLDADKVVFYSNFIAENDIWEHIYFAKELQSGDDLGAKMKKAFQWGFDKSYEKVVLIGSDLLDITKEHIETAFEALDHNDVILGPALDGGYYLLGLKKMYPQIFYEKSWGTNTVLRKTLQDLEKVQVHLLEELNDIDVIEDIENHPAFIHFLSDS